MSLRGMQQKRFKELKDRLYAIIAEHGTICRIDVVNQLRAERFQDYGFWAGGDLYNAFSKLKQAGLVHSIRDKNEKSIYRRFKYQLVKEN